VLEICSSGAGSVDAIKEATDDSREVMLEQSPVGLLIAAK